MNQIVHYEKFVYNLLVTEHTKCGEETMSFLFNKLADARKWVKKDIAYNKKEWGDKVYTSLNKIYFSIQRGDDWIVWDIRKLPLQTSADWTDPEYSVTYKKGN